MMSCQRVPRRISVQNDIFRGISSPETEQNSLFCSSCSPGVLEFGTEACFEHILVPQETRFPGRCCFSWTRILAFNASVPKNMKNEFVQARSSRSKPLYRDEKIRKKGFCAETRMPYFRHEMYSTFRSASSVITAKIQPLFLVIILVLTSMES